MKSHTISDYDRGQKDGVRRALMFYTLAVHNVYGFNSVPLQKLLTEAERIANEATMDKEWFDRMKTYLHDLGVEV